MDHVGIDIHKNQSQVCILTEAGGMVERRIRTERIRFGELFGGMPRARIVIEASTESEWVARCLEEAGHEVIVADPNFAPMYATRSRRVKTDRRDARTLAEACRVEVYRPAHRTSDAQRQVRAQLAVREALVRTRSRYISVVRSLLRREGLRVRGGEARTLGRRVGELEVPPALASAIEPLLVVLEDVNEQIAWADQELARRVREDADLRRLTTLPGVGPVTSTTFKATLDEVARFRGASQVAAYLGLVPRERSSGEKQQRGHITKAGNSRARTLLIEAAWLILRGKRDDTTALREWAEQIARRRGKRIAAVALARRLARILFAMWRDATAYAPARIRGATLLPQMA
jgi:transposase